MLMFPSGTPEQVTLYLVDNATPFCGDHLACAQPSTNKIWLSVESLDKFDKCGRNVLRHEVYHLWYPENDIHIDCWTYP